MSNTLLTYYATKDVGEVYRDLETIMSTDPMAPQNVSLMRNTAAFFYILEKRGERLTEWPKDRYSITIEQAQAMLGKGDVNLARVSAAALFMVVQEIVRRWLESVTTAEAVGGMYEQMHANFDTAPMEVQSLSQADKDAGVQQSAEAMLAPHPGTILDLPEFDDPKCNDMCYVLWGATGDRRYIERVITALDQPSDKSTRKGQVGRTAAWSLSSLCQQYRDIDAIVSSVPGAGAKMRALLAG